MSPAPVPAVHCPTCAADRAAAQHARARPRASRFVVAVAATSGQQWDALIRSVPRRPPGPMRPGEGRRAHQVRCCRRQRCVSSRQPQLVLAVLARLAAGDPHRRAPEPRRPRASPPRHRRLLARAGLRRLATLNAVSCQFHPATASIAGWSGECRSSLRDGISVSGSVHDGGASDDPS